MHNALGIVDDPLFLEHRASGPHPERPERLYAARSALVSADIALPRRELPARDATADELNRVHDARYIELLAGAAGNTGHFDADTFYAPASVAAANRAAGGALALVDALHGGEVGFGLALLRPPGHHARPAGAMGFCLLNNVALAAAHARSRGARRVAIIDWDVHHGNGTQEMFYDDPSVLFVSLHQFPFYPGTGKAEETGLSDGRGFTVNVPLSEGADDAVYAAAFDRLIGPILNQYDPDLVLISAGFDAHRRDPLASMRVTDEGYAQMLLRILGSLPRDAQGRLAVLLEGGYDLEGLKGSLRSTIEMLDPAHRPPSLAQFSEPLSTTHERDLTRARDALRPFWKLD